MQNQASLKDSNYTIKAKAIQNEDKRNDIIKTMKHYDVVAAIICFEGKYLCMQKGATRYDYTSYKYEFPGGKIEPGETPEHALHRELLEEMEYPIVVGKLFTTVEYSYPDFSIKLQAFLCTAANEHFELKEHVAFQWLEKSDLCKLDWVAADAKIVQELTKQVSISKTK